MIKKVEITEVGVQDPELKNSTIYDRMDEDEEPLEVDYESSVCYFNNTMFPHGGYVKSGDEYLYCDHGLWIRKGSDHPN